MKKVYELDFAGRTITVETGELAKQTNGSVLVRYGETVVLSVAVMGKNPMEQDFFPLQVRYEEKLYSVGKIPGGFLKRESRPSDHATLTSRLIDRPIRPMFDDNFRYEIQIISTVLSVDQDNTPEMSALLGSSLALGISNIPFDGPVAGVIVGKIGKEYIINPTEEQIERSSIYLVVAGTKDAINMVEAEADEVDEKEMLEAIMFGHEHIKMLCEFQEEIIGEIGEEKLEIEIASVDKDVDKAVRKFATKDMFKAIQIKDKLEKYERIDEVKKETIEHFTEEYLGVEGSAGLIKQVKNIVEQIEADEVRNLITDKKIRPDGRKMNEIRDMSAEIDLLPRPHGSAVFTRGQTQALATTTLGSIAEYQILDGIGFEDEKRFLLHYNFPQFSVGETGRYGAPGRREIGHGALGERALLKVIPSEEEFPYTIRVVSEVLESNGSSSQATICAGCLSLMAAGVPIKAPVAGIAMGLVTSANGKKHTILTDIQGLEDHLGDMDFKVAGTKDGITALQMDIKIQGITKKILKESLEQARDGRLEILKVMNSVIAEPRLEVGKYAPKMDTFMINPDRIKDVVGKGGETITKIILETSNVESVNDKMAVKIDIEDDGKVIIYHMDREIINQARAKIEDCVREPEEGQVYEVKVVKVEDFGCFVELWPGTEGMVHVSKLAFERVDKPSDIVKVGDTIMVKCLGYDQRGRLNLSRRDALPKSERPERLEEKDKKYDKKDKKYDKKDKR